MRIRSILILSFIAFGAMCVSAQTQCPENLVCISREAAIKAVEDGEAVKAQAVQITELKQALTDKDKLLDEVKIKLAAAMGENSALKQNDVSNRAIIEYLVKNLKRKCLPFSICVLN